MAMQKEKCAKAWRDLTGHKDVCKAPDGRANGHVLDTCAGGAADPQGCFLVMDFLCNSSMGAQCGTRKIHISKNGTISIVFGTAVC